MEDEDEDEEDINEQAFKHSNWTLEQLFQFKNKIQSIFKDETFYKALNTIIDYKLDYPSDFEEHYKEDLYYQKQGIKKYFEKYLKEYTENKNKFREIETNILLKKLRKYNKDYLKEEEFKYIEDSLDIIKRNVEIFKQKFKPDGNLEIKDEVKRLKDKIKEEKELKEKEIRKNMKEEKSKIIKEINNIIDNKNENSKYDKSINKYVDEINGIHDKNKLSLSELNKYLKLIKEGTNKPKTINNININISVRNEQKNENNFKNRIKFFESKK